MSPATRPAAAPHRSELLRSPMAGLHAVVAQSARGFPRHWHDTHGIGVMVRGAHRSRSGRGDVEAIAGDVITHDPGEVHDGRPLGDGPRHWWMLHLEPEALARLVDRPGEAHRLELARPVLQDAPLREALHGLFTRLRVATPDAMADEEALARVVSHLVRAHPGLGLVREARVPDADLRRVRERLEDGGPDTPTLAALAAEAGLSRWQLLRRFEAVYGLSPHGWLQQCRLRRARSLIARGLPLADVAADCGFADQSHMTRLFARQLGYTPGAWRRNQVQDVPGPGR